PVRWIETQDVLFAARDNGGLGIERFVEVGVAQSPTVANLASSTLKLPGRRGPAIEVVNIERDGAVVFATDEDPPNEEPAAEEPGSGAATDETPAAHTAQAPAEAAPR